MSGLHFKGVGHSGPARSFKCWDACLPRRPNTLVAEGNDLDPGGDGGWEGSAVVVTLLLVPPLRCSTICAGCSMHIGVEARVDERNVKDHFLAARHEGQDVAAFGHACVTGTGAPRWGAASTLRAWGDRAVIGLGPFVMVLLCHSSECG